MDANVIEVCSRVWYRTQYQIVPDCRSANAVPKRTLARLVVRARKNADARMRHAEHSARFANRQNTSKPLSMKKQIVDSGIQEGSCYFADSAEGGGVDHGYLLDEDGVHGAGEFPYDLSRRKVVQCEILASNVEADIRISLDFLKYIVSSKQRKFSPWCL